MNNPLIASPIRVSRIISTPCCRTGRAVLEEMERQAKGDDDIPIVGPAVARMLFQYARLIKRKQCSRWGRPSATPPSGGRWPWARAARFTTPTAATRRPTKHAGILSSAGVADRIEVHVGDAHRGAVGAQGTVRHSVLRRRQARLSSRRAHGPGEKCARAACSLPTTLCGKANSLMSRAILACRPTADPTHNARRYRAEPDALRFAGLVHHHHSAAGRSDGGAAGIVHPLCIVLQPRWGQWSRL